LASTQNFYFIFYCFAEFVVTPGRSWMLQTGRVYRIHVEIFDKESRKIYPSEVHFIRFLC